MPAGFTPRRYRYDLHRNRDHPLLAVSDHCPLVADMEL